MSLSDLVEMEIGGVSVTPRGLAAILVPAGGAKDALPRASNAVETLRGAEVDVVPREFASAPALAVLVTDTDADADAATSEYAQAMMQYLQDPPCDMGIQLPYDALDRVTGGPSGAVLGAVLVGRAEFDFAFADDPANDGAGPFRWAATLLAGKDFEQSAHDVIGGAREAWTCLALARRYESFGCRVFVTKDVLARADPGDFFATDPNRGGGEEKAEGFALGDVRSAFPRMQTVGEMRAIANEANEKFLRRPFLDAAALEAEEEDDDVI